ncbi:MAG: DUF2283 domain-containing protein [Patescibacteria group bacterium]
MKITYDKVADAMYIYLNKAKVAKTIKLKGRLLADVDKKGRVIGIEVLNVSSQIPLKQIASSVKTGVPVFA